MKVRTRFHAMLGFIVLAVLALLSSESDCSAFVHAQEIKANLEGIITDPTGALIPAAALSVRNNATGFQRTTRADDSGFFSFRLLPPGEYQLTVEADGFARKILTGIQLEIDQTARVNVELPLLTLIDEETVVSESSLVESASAAIGDVIENRRIEDLPLNGRNFIQLSLLVPGVTVAPQGGTMEQWNTAGGRLGFSSNGQRDDRNVFTLDGVTIQEPSILVININPAPDAIQEFKVLQNSYSAEAGSFGGGQVNITTKAGTNEFHGTAYEFLRNEKLDAKNFFDDPVRPVPPFKQNQFGFSLSGPLVRDQSFFFGNYEGLRIRFSPTTLTRLPTEKERRGDFSGINLLTGREYRTIFDPDTCPFGCRPFPGNMIPPERLDPLARAVLARMPLPNFATNQPGFNHLNVGREPTGVDQFTLRGDHRFSQEHLLFGRFSYLDSAIVDDFVGNLFGSNPPPPSGFGTSRHDSGRNLAIGLTSALTPAVLNEFRFGYNRFRGEREHVNRNSGFLNEFAGYRAPGSDNTAMPSFSIGAGFGDLGDADIFVPNRRDNDIFQFVDNIVWVRGRHTLKIGADYRYIKNRNTIEIFSNGTFSFQGDTPLAATGNLFEFQGGLALADFLLGRPWLSFYTAGNGTDNMRLQYLGAYFNAEWRIHPRLTLSYGLREEFYTGPTDQDAEAAILDPADGTRAIVSAPGGRIKQSLLDDPLTRMFAGQFTFVTNQEAGLPLSLWRPDYQNLQPRLGLAWDLFGSGKSILRAGAGVYVGLINLGVISDMHVPPVSFHLFGIDLHRFPDTFDVFSPLTYEQAYTTGNVAPFPETFDPYLRNATVYQFSADLQHQLSPSLILSLAYTGSRAIHLLRRAEFNQGVPNGPCPGTPDPENPRVIICDPGASGRMGQRLKPGGSAFNNVADASSAYHGFVARLEKRMTRGLAFTVGYTFSKSLDLASSLNETRSNPTLAVDTFRLDLEKGRSDFDTPHRFVLSGLWELPFGPGRRWLQGGWVRHVAGSWQISSILSLQSGVPLSGRLGFSNTGTNKGSTVERPDLECDPNRVPGGRHPERWFDTGCFRVPLTYVDGPNQSYGVIGNAGRNIVDGPPFGSLDLSLQKLFHFSERHSLQFRADLFNLTNHPSFRNPGLILDAPNFGVVTEAYAPRQIQFSLRFSF